MVDNLIRNERVAELAWRARSNFETFLNFTQNVKIAAHQKEWARHLQFIGDHPNVGHKVLIIAPPGAGKSTVMCSFLSWMIGRYPDDHLGLISYGGEPARERSVAVRDILDKSNPYKMVFPGIEKDPTHWNKASFRVKRKTVGDIHPTLRSAGSNSAVIGYRLGGLLYDDPQDEKNSDKSWKREKVWFTYENSIYTRVIETGWQVFIGTRFADDDFCGRMKASGLILPENVVFVPALNSKGESYWPEQYPLTPEVRDEQGLIVKEASKLWATREKTPKVFYLQYMGDTTGGEAGIIRKVTHHNETITVERGVSESGYPYVRVWVGDDYKAADRDNRALLVGIGFDTALKKGRENDYTVGYIGGLDRDGNVWILDRVKDRYGSPELIDLIKELYEKWMPYCIWIEDSAQGTPVVQMIQAELPFLPITTVPVAQGGSVSRANSLTPYLHKGQIKFSQMNDWFEDTRYYLTHFPNTDHDDDLDALFVLVDSLMRVRHPASYTLKPQTARISMR